jgi:hypothetical protein
MKKLFILFLFVIGFTTFKAQVVYKDVAGIFYARCTSCHHEGANHISFMNYTSTKIWTGMINYDLTNNIMPPWKADTSYTRFQHERTISASEKNDILFWIAGGALKGDTTQAPAAPVYPTNYQLQGVPDAEIKIPTFTSTATGSDIYVCIAIPTGLTQDRYIRAFEIVPGNKPIVHHAIVAADSTGSYVSDYSGSCYNIPGNSVIGTYAPGTSATVFPNSSVLRAGIKLKAGSQIIMQMHYPKGSAGQVDSTKIRIYYYPIGTPNIRPIYVTTPLQNWNFFLPANQTTTVTAYYPTSGTLTNTLSVFAVFPHSHLLGKSMLNYAVKPGIDTIPLINIPAWDFEWQDYYVYKNLVKIPSGYRLFSKHVFDNTTSNINNPSSPPVNVFPGTGTKDEMFFDGMMSMAYMPGDENINMDSLMKADTLYWSGIKEMDKEAIVRAVAYPNPFTDHVSIKYVLKENADVAFEFSDITGRVITRHELGKKEEGFYEFIWKAKNSNGQTLPDGIYFYRIKAKDQHYTGKIIKQ